MNATHPLARLTLSFLLLALLAGVAACAKAPAVGPQAWIDAPADGTTLPAGLPVPVVCRASAPKGVAEVLLEVNGAPYRNMPVAGDAETCAVTIDWLPAGSGPFTLQVTAYDSTGTGSSPATVFVKVEGATPAPAESPTETPALAATATATVEAEPPTAPTIAAPSDTPMPTAAPTATPYPPPEVTFGVDRNAIDEGECTRLHWSVEYVTAVYLDGEGVVGEDSRDVCPRETTTYNLHIEAPGGDVDASVTVTVRPDETPPPVPRLGSPESGAVLGAVFFPMEVTLNWSPNWSPVKDPTGVAYEVMVRVKDGAIWRIVGDWDTDATTIKVQIERTGAYQWGVRARDGAGNTSDWAQADFRVGSYE